MAITPKDIINFREIWKKIQTVTGISNPTEFLWEMFQTTNPLTDVYTYYVDPVLGNDSNSGSDSSVPLRTLTAAIAKIPKVVSLPYTINCAVGIYTEQVTFEGFTFVGTGGITVNGTMTTTTVATGNTTGTVTSFTAASGTTLSYITDSSQSLTADDLKGKWLKITSGAASGTFYPIYGNTATQIYILQTTVTASVTYEIVDQGTIFRSTSVAVAQGATGLFQFRNNRSWGIVSATGILSGFLIQRIQSEGTLIDNASCWYVFGTEYIRMVNCTGKTIATSILRPALRVVNTGSLSCTNCYFVSTAASVSPVVISDVLIVTLQRCHIRGSSGTLNAGVASLNGIGSLSLIGSVIEKTDASGTVVNMVNVRGGQAQSEGVFIFGMSTATTGLVMGFPSTIADTTAALWGASSLRIKSVGTGVVVNPRSLLVVNTPTLDTVATAGLYVVKGGQIIVPSTITFLNGSPTNELNLDGTGYTVANLDAASPTSLTNNYNSVICR